MRKSQEENAPAEVLAPELHQYLLPCLPKKDATIPFRRTKLAVLENSVPDMGRFDTDPDPTIRTVLLVYRSEDANKIFLF